MSREDVEEVTSDVFVTLWQNSEKPDDAKLKAWLGAVSRNAAKNKLREANKRLPLEEEYFDTGDSKDIEHRLTDKEEAKIIRYAIQTMTPPDDKIFLLHYYSLQTVSQISASLGLSVSAVKMRLARGREKLRATLEKGGISR
jgi:RNA polymerase sigma-70 factor (ECF subfamily)